MLHQSSISFIVNKIYFITNTAIYTTRKIYFTPLFHVTFPSNPFRFLAESEKKISPIYKQIPLCYL